MVSCQFFYYLCEDIILLSNLKNKKMKKLGKLKLNQFSKAELEKREMNALKGGCSCACPCAGGDQWTNAMDKKSSTNYGY